MKAPVVYESMFGNTEQVARAIATGLAETLEVEVCDIAHASADPTRGSRSSWQTVPPMRSR